MSKEVHPSDQLPHLLLQADALQFGSLIKKGIYAADAGDRTYKRLAELAGAVLQAGWPVIVDATFLERHRRDSFRRLAEKFGVPYMILDFRASESALKNRIRARSAAGSDASEADLSVLNRQIARYMPLSEDEAEFTLVIDTECMSGGAAAVQVQKRLAA